MVSRVFVSYSRQDKPKVDGLVQVLSGLGHQVWLDEALRGGQSWWDEILREVSACDAFLAAVSASSLNSVACQRERAYADDLGKPVLPVAVDRLTQALPRGLSVLQVVDYASPSVESAVKLFRALAGLPHCPPLPDPLPPKPPPPLSYLTDLFELLDAAELTKAEQRRLLDELEPALRSADLEERLGGRQILQRLRARDDLFADTERRMAALQSAATAADLGVGSRSAASPTPTAEPPPTSEQRPESSPAVAQGEGASHAQRVHGADASRVVVRRPASMVRDFLRAYRIDVDGEFVGKVHNGGEVTTVVVPGQHRVRAVYDWIYRSPEVEVHVAPGQTVHLLVETPGGMGAVTRSFRREGYLMLSIEPTEKRGAGVGEHQGSTSDAP
jgi:hypothetical protein